MSVHRIVIAAFIAMCLVSQSKCFTDDMINKEVSPKSQDVDVIKYPQAHTIEIEQLVRQLKKAGVDIALVIRERLQAVFPTVYDQIETLTVPEVQAFLPVYHKLVLPRIQKLGVYSIRLGNRIFEKVYQSWELSNSTHITVVPFDDIIDEVLRDIEHFSRTIMPYSQITKRSKRSLPFISSFMGFIKPIFKSVATSIARSIDGHDNTVCSQLLLPIVFDMIDDPVTFHDLQKLFWSTKSVVSPILYEMMRNQHVQKGYHPYGSAASYYIPQRTIDSALQRLHYETKPIIMKILERHLPMILRRVSQNVKLIVRTLEQIEARSGPKVKVLKLQVTSFVLRHGDLFGALGTRYINSRTLISMKKDLLPIKTTLLEIFMDYMSHQPNGWGNLLAHSISVLNRF
ncbi:hypothetical protein JTE90_027012 [Oedothorax gibbosus]|uniref:Uncharacterized protein n=1 Tax=Oedothorax gibbosus TaxID=931172 RepID=A0AAV6VB41_9ARAC|nr:hypothetical protein JTE90_027012 [Oedothorax gibbosus]